MQISKSDFRLGPSCAKFSPSGRLLASIGERLVRIWDVEKRAIVSKTLFVYACSLAFSPDEQFVAIKNTTGAIIVVSVSDGEVISRFKPKFNDMDGFVVFSADGKYVLSGNHYEGRIEFRRTGDLKRGAVTKFGDWWLNDLCVSHDRKTFVASVSSTGVAGRVLTCSNPAPGKSWRLRLEIPLKEGARLSRGCISPDGKRVAVIHEFWDHLSVFDLNRSGSRRRATTEIKRGYTALDWSPDGEVLATTEERHWTFFKSRTLEKIVSLRDEYPSSVSFSPDGSLVALGSQNEGVVLPWAEVLRRGR